MLSETQYKAIELFARGFRGKKIADLLGIKSTDVRNWSNNDEYVDELNRAVETFQRYALNERTIGYRQIQKAIQEEILARIEDGELGKIPLDKLMRMLGSATLSSKQDEGTPQVALTQNNMQINQIAVDQEFMQDFGKLLRDKMDPNDIVTVVEKVEKELLE